EGHGAKHSDRTDQIARAHETQHYVLAVRRRLIEPDTAPRDQIMICRRVALHEGLIALFQRPFPGGTCDGVRRSRRQPVKERHLFDQSGARCDVHAVLPSGADEFGLSLSQRKTVSAAVPIFRSSDARKPPIKGAKEMKTPMSKLVSSLSALALSAGIA